MEAARDAVIAADTRLVVVERTADIVRLDEICPQERVDLYPKLRVPGYVHDLKARQPRTRLVPAHVVSSHTVPLPTFFVVQQDDGQDIIEVSDVCKSHISVLSK